MYKYFLILLGTTQSIIAVAEFISPLRSFLIWRMWILNRFFPIHGVALIFIGLPLTLYNGYLSGVIFFIGLVVVFTGPFILIYPEKIRKALNNSGDTFKDNEIKIIIFLDAFLRICTGFIFMISSWKTFFN